MGLLNLNSIKEIDDRLNALRKELSDTQDLFDSCTNSKELAILSTQAGQLRRQIRNEKQFRQRFK